MEFKIRSHLGKKEFRAFFDDEDVMKLFNYRWCLSWINKRTVYASARDGRTGKKVHMHSLIMPSKPGLVIDHINGNGLDNRKSNLRYCTHADNLRKRPPQNGKKYKGVYCHNNLKIKKWSASVHTKNGTIHAGYYKTEHEAAEAYNKIAMKYFNDPYCLNKIDNKEH